MMLLEKSLYSFYYLFYKIHRAMVVPPRHYFDRSGYVKSATFILGGLIMLSAYSALKILLPEKEHSTIFLSATVCMVLSLIGMSIFESRKKQLRYRYAYKESGRYTFYLILIFILFDVIAFAIHKIIELADIL